MSPLLKGLLLGFSIAAPVGPIGLLCIRRSIVDGRRAGFVSGLGAATADGIYGAIAALGLTAMMNLLFAYRAWLQVGGGAFLVYLGIATLRSRPDVVGQRVRSRSEGGSELPTCAFASTFFLTLANPMTILSFLAIFAGAGVEVGRGILPPVLMVLGVFLGSAAWWLILSTIAGCLGTRLEQGGLRIVNLVAGLVLLAAGLWQLGGVLIAL
ncbi:MAG TPA: LysE family transporter [Opitutaceae bacterium]|nr:LysE family transporter [Opitutaceae bacterium]